MKVKPVFSSSASKQPQTNDKLAHLAPVRPTANAPDGPIPFDPSGEM